METKKNKRINTEDLRVPTVFLGIFIVGSIVTMSFAFKEPVISDRKDNLQQLKEDIPVEYVVEEKIVENDVPKIKIVETPEPIIEPTEKTKTKENNDEDETIKVPVAPIIIIDSVPSVAPIAPIVEYPEKVATFPGGVIPLKTFLLDNIKYPERSQTIGDQGKVYVEFVVNTDGSIEQIKVIRSVSTELDNEAKRVIRKMPNWIPAESKGEKVRARCRIPLNFELRP